MSILYIKDPSSGEFIELPVIRGTDGKDIDVQINGTSIVENDIANIKFGATMSVNSNKSIDIKTAGPTSIANRTSNNFIQSSYIDQVVKAALTDGKGAEYTNNEKIAACNRLGLIGGDYTLITSVTTTENTSAFEYEFESPVDEIVLLTSHASNIESGSSNGSITIYDEQNNSLGYTAVTQSFNAAVRLSVFKVCRIGGRIFGEAASGFNADGWYPVYWHITGNGCGKHAFNKIKKFRYATLNNYYISNGATFNVYAR